MTYSQMMTEAPKMESNVNSFTDIYNRYLKKINNVEQIKNDFKTSYSSKTYVSKETAERIVNILDELEAFKEEYLKYRCINVVIAIYKLISENPNIEVNIDELFNNLLSQSILQERIFNRDNGRERWETKLQDGVVNKFQTILNEIKFLDEFIKNRAIITRENGNVEFEYNNLPQFFTGENNTSYILGATLPGIVGRIADVVNISDNNIKNVIVLTSNRAVFNKNIIETLSKVKNYNELKSLIDNKKITLTPEQRAVINIIGQENFTFEKFKEDLLENRIDEDYVAINLAKFMLKKEGIENLEISTIKSELKITGEPRVTTVGTIVEMLTKKYEGNAKFISSQGHVLPQYLQIFYDVFYDVDPKRIADDYGISEENREQFIKSFEQFKRDGFAVFGREIKEINSGKNYTEMTEGEKKQVENSVKLILQNIAGSFNSFIKYYLDKNCNVNNKKKFDNINTILKNNDSFLILISAMKEIIINNEQNDKNTETIRNILKNIEDNYLIFKKNKEEFIQKQKELKKVKRKIEKTKRQIKARGEKKKQEELKILKQKLFEVEEEVNKINKINSIKEDINKINTINNDRNTDISLVIKEMNEMVNNLNIIQK